jgi:ribosomal-protein-alanine N-acetyltransferase
MSACPTLQTERLVLRPFRESDLEAHTELLQAPQVQAMLHLPHDVGREQAWAQMAAWAGQWELRGTGQWALEERATGAFVGRAGTHRPERHDWPGIEVGWALHPAYWGQGYATEAGARAMAYAFDHFAVGELWSLILPENLPSQAVARRLGFGLVDQRVLSFFPTKAHGRWRLTRDEWRLRSQSHGHGSSSD